MLYFHGGGFLGGLDSYIRVRERAPRQATGGVRRRRLRRSMHPAYDDALAAFGGGA